MTTGRRRGRRLAVAFVVAVMFALSAASRAAGAAPGESGRSAVIVLLGGAGDNPDLSAVLSELLRRQDVGVELVREEKLNTSELLAGKGDRAVRVYVELRGPGEATLYFRGPRAQRYLLRRLELPDGLDEVGRELIAQVVASSVDSLLRSSEGMTHAEMRAALVGDSVPPAAASPAAVSLGATPPPNAAAPPAAAASLPAPAPDGATRSAPSSPKGPPADGVSPVVAASAVSAPVSVKPKPSGPPLPSLTATPRQPVRRGDRWSGWLAARYMFAWSGPDIGGGHGPGIEIGVLHHDAVRLGARLSGERLFAQTVPTTNIDTDLQSSQIRLLIDASPPVSYLSGVSIGAGGGVDITKVTPGMVYDPLIAAAAPQRKVTPIARAELRYEVGTATWRLTAVALADISIFDTHYDINRGGTTERAATPWRVRPGGAVVLGWRPTWREK